VILTFKLKRATNFHANDNNYAPTLETFITLARQLSLGLDDGKQVIGHSRFTRSNLYKIYE
jgi:hypothetical protein